MLNKDSISHIHNSDKIYGLVWKQKEWTTVSLLLMRKIAQYYPKKLNIFLLQLSDSGLHHLDPHNSLLLWDPHTQALIASAYIFMLSPGGDNSLQEAWLCWTVNGANSPASLPQSCTEADQLWTPSAGQDILWWAGLLSLRQLFLLFTLNCLHQLICFLSILPIFWMVWRSLRYQGMEEWEGHPTARGWRTNQEDALSPTSLCKQLCKGELARC